MTLEIRNSSGEDLDKFVGVFLLKKIKQYCISIVERRKLIRLDEFLNSTKMQHLKERGVGADVRLSSYRIVQEAINHLIYQKFANGNYLIEINPNVIVKGLTAKLSELAKLINYGCLSVPPYPIFDNTFDYIANHISIFYDEYLEE